MQDQDIFLDFFLVSPDAVFICGSSTIFQIDNPAIKIETIFGNTH